MPIDRVIKRNGSVVPFDRERIEDAIYAAARAVDDESGRPWAEMLSWAVTGLLEKKFRSNGTGSDGHRGNGHRGNGHRGDGEIPSIGMVPHVEEIQDIVEEVLIKSGRPQIAKAYILYRQQRAAARDARQLLLDGDKLVEDYLHRADWRVNENSNMNYSLQGLNFYIASSIAARYWLNKVYPIEVQRAHTEGDFHIHDLGMLSTYCCGWDLQALLSMGFGGVPAKLESKPPKHFRTALGQLVNFFYTLQGESAGAQAVSNFDTLLAPFIRYDGLDYKGVKQAMQEFIFNINVPTRVGFQTPFTNVTMDLTPSLVLRDEPVIIGGVLQDEVYGDFQHEMDMLNRAFAETMLEGDAKGRVFTFPIPTYNVSDDFDWENPVLEPVWRMTAKYGIPYFANFINSDMKPEDARSMCCRLRLDNRELRKRGGGLFGANPLTGSIGVVTINMPRLGYQAHDEADFFERLAQLMDVARTSLDIKRKILEQLTDQGLYPYSCRYLSSVKQGQGAYWANHFSTIGLNGMNEACENFIGVNIAHPDGKEFSVRVLTFMRQRLSAYQQETGHLFNLEATPAEGASYRLAKTDRSKYPEIVAAGTEAVPYYTNSTHLPVEYTEDLFEALEHQDDLQVMYTGGTVLHGFIGEQIDDWRQARLLVRRIAENFRLPYYTLTPTFSVCPVHGYIAGEHKYCPYEHSEQDLEQLAVKVD